MAENDFKWVKNEWNWVGGSKKGWEYVGMGGSRWKWMGIGGSRWKWVRLGRMNGGELEWVGAWFSKTQNKIGLVIFRKNKKTK